MSHFSDFEHLVRGADHPIEVLDGGLCMTSTDMSTRCIVWARRRHSYILNRVCTSQTSMMDRSGTTLTTDDEAIAISSMNCSTRRCGTRQAVIWSARPVGGTGKKDFDLTHVKMEVYNDSGPATREQMWYRDAVERVVIILGSPAFRWRSYTSDGWKA